MNIRVVKLCVFQKRDSTMSGVVKSSTKITRIFHATVKQNRFQNLLNYPAGIRRISVIET